MEMQKVQLLNSFHQLKQPLRLHQARVVLAHGTDQFTLAEHAPIASPNVAFGHFQLSFA
jgi:hypothetical protein